VSLINSADHSSLLISPITAASEARIAVLGLGYVGLPLALAFSRCVPTLGFDLNAHRVAELQAQVDSTGELTTDECAELTGLALSQDIETLRSYGASVYIVAVPTPVDLDRRPDLTPLVRASAMIATLLKRGDLVIYESTVYPGCTEGECVPILERDSGLRLNTDFFVGYSPERINPGDKNRRLTDIVKITSGSTPAAGLVVDGLYKKVVKAGTFLAADIKTAEAAKIIENTQRDVQIALANEFAMLFARLGLDSQAVFDAAATKWNFTNVRPGLVGGHCIGVDPYYLIQCAERVGMPLPIVTQARSTNERMPQFVVSQIAQLASHRGLVLPGSNCLVCGITFKEDCPDLRNSKVVDLIAELERAGAHVAVFDPIADADECLEEYGIRLLDKIPEQQFDFIVIAVAHKEFKSLGIAPLRGAGKAKHMLYDMKRCFTRAEVDGAL